MAPKNHNALPCLPSLAQCTTVCETIFNPSFAGLDGGHKATTPLNFNGKARRDFDAFQRQSPVFNRLSVVIGKGLLPIKPKPREGGSGTLDFGVPH